MTAELSHRGAAVTVALLLLTSMLAVGPGIVVAVEESEPNDSRADARVITEGETVTGTVSNGDEPDLYAVELERGETINASVVVRGDPGTDVEIRDPSGRDISAGERGKNETLRAGLTAPTAGTYYVRITSLSSGTVSYSLRVRTYRTDEAEPDEDRGNATAASPATVYDRQLSIGDTDVYTVEATAGQEINLSTTAQGPNGIEFDLMTAGWNNIGGVRAKTGAEYGGATAPYTGTYYVRVTRLGGRSGLSYTMEIKLAETTDREPNEDMGNATNLSLNASVEDALSVGDTDWYALTVREGDSIEVSGSLAESDGGIDFTLKMANNTKLSGEGNVAGEESYGFNATAPTTGTYYIQVERSSWPGPAYTMNVRTNGTGDLPVESPGQVGGGDVGGAGTANGNQAQDGGGLPVLPLLLVLLVVVLVVAFLLYRRRDGDGAGHRRPPQQ